MARGKLKKNIGKLKPAKIVRSFDNKEKLILRDYLAMQRTTLANERTLFSYIRTSLYLVLGGIGLIEVEVFQNLRWVGFLALVVSVILFIYGIARYIALRQKLIKFYETIEIHEESQPENG